MTNASPRLPDKEALERQQLYLTNKKLEQETKPEKWWSKLVKNAIAFGGLVTLAATAYGIYDLYNKTMVDRERARIADHRTRFEDAIKRLELSSTISKLVGVSVLSLYLGSADKEEHHQILFTLAGLMATEKDSQTQAAVINLIELIAEGEFISHADWGYFQDMLVTQSRALMQKGNLSRHRQFQPASPLSDEEQAARTVGKLIAINIRKGKVPGRVNYRGIYCEECDFHGAPFPQKVDFTGAVLDGANFTRANLVAALFDNAELAGTKFVESDLRHAQFRSMDESIVDADDNDRVPAGRTTYYLGHIASALGVNAAIDIRMPNFSCANLEDAAFGRHALFPGVMGWQRVYNTGEQIKPDWYQSMPQYLKDQAQKNTIVAFPPATVVPPKFFKANMKNARLEETRFFTFSDSNAEYPSYLNSVQGQPFGDVMLLQGPIRDEVLRIDTESNDHTIPHKGTARDEVKERAYVELFQQRLRAAFYSVEFDQASLPANVMDFLKKSKATLVDYRATFLRSPIAPDDLDLGCAPRR